MNAVVLDIYRRVNFLNINLANRRFFDAFQEKRQRKYHVTHF